MVFIIVNQLFDKEKGELYIFDNDSFNLEVLVLQPERHVIYASFGYMHCGAVLGILYVHKLLSYVFKDTGELYTWGKNNINGQLGVGDFNDHEVPTKVESLQYVKTVSCGGFHTIAVLGACSIVNLSKNALMLPENEDIFVWGKNDFGQLGIGPLPHNPYKKVESPTHLPAFSSHRTKQICCGFRHSVALLGLLKLLSQVIQFRIWPSFYLGIQWQWPTGSR